MNDSKISVRYAKALFESALEKNVLDDVLSDMQMLRQMSILPEFIHLVNTPVIKESQKSGILGKALENKVNELTLSLMHLLVKNGREQFIAGIARNFIDLYRRHKGIRTAVFTTAGKVSDEIKSQVERAIRDALKSNVDLTMEINEELIGGFKIRIEDLQYDASVAESLNKMKKQLLKP